VELLDLFDRGTAWVASKIPAAMAHPDDPTPARTGRCATRQGHAAADLARALRPGGRVGITDVWVHPDLDPDLRGLAGRVARLADPRPIDELQAIVTRAGLIVTHVERHDQALLDTIDRVTTRPRALRLVDLLILRRFNLERGI